MSILVTGAAGFIGSTTTLHLLNLGYEVIALDDLSKGQRANVPKGAHFLQADCGDAEVIARLENIEACIHFAANIEVGESMASPETYFNNNVGNTFQLIEALTKLNVRSFIFSSSCAVYGNANGVISESFPTNPTSPYGQSKLMVEQGLNWIAKQGKLRYASLRYFNASGSVPGHPERHNPETHLIPLAIASAMQDDDVFSIFGDDYETFDGTCVRDFVHVNDLARAHIAALTALEETNEIIVNIGSGKGHSIKEVLRVIENVTGHDITSRVASRRPGDQAMSIADISWAREVLRWEPKDSTIEKVVHDAWRGYLETSAKQKHNSKFDDLH